MAANSPYAKWFMSLNGDAERQWVGSKAAEGSPKGLGRDKKQGA
jgi:hypothetical protein